jgi:hypothetical protein
VNKALAIREYAIPAIIEGSGDDDHPIAEWSDGVKWAIVNITIGEMKQWPKLHKPRLTASETQAKGVTTMVGKQANAEKTAEKAAEKAAIKVAKTAEKAAEKVAKAAAAKVAKAAAKKISAKAKTILKRPATAASAAAADAAKVSKKGPPLPDEYKDKVPLVMPEIGSPSQVIFPLGALPWRVTLWDLGRHWLLSLCGVVGQVGR